MEMKKTEPRGCAHSKFVYVDQPLWDKFTLSVYVCDYLTD